MTSAVDDLVGAGYQVLTRSAEMGADVFVKNDRSQFVLSAGPSGIRHDHAAAGISSRRRPLPARRKRRLSRAAPVLSRCGERTQPGSVPPPRAVVAQSGIAGGLSGRQRRGTLRQVVARFGAAALSQLADVPDRASGAHDDQGQRRRLVVRPRPELRRPKPAPRCLAMRRHPYAGAAMCRGFRNGPRGGLRLTLSATSA